MRGVCDLVNMRSTARGSRPGLLCRRFGRGRFRDLGIDCFGFPEAATAQATFS
jgi:hypothetical protein